MWYEKKKKFIEGVKLISLNISDTKQFEDALTKYYKSSEDDEFSQLELLSGLSHDENLLISKTLFYIAHRLKLFLLSPVKLQSDLTDLGFTAEQAETVVKLYSEASRHITNNIRTEESSENDTSITWEVKTSLDETNLRHRTPVARLCLKTDNQEMTLEDLNRSQLASLFDKFETIQKELDVISAKRNA